MLYLGMRGGNRTTNGRETRSSGRDNNTYACTPQSIQTLLHHSKHMKRASRYNRNRMTRPFQPNSEQQVGTNPSLRSKLSNSDLKFKVSIFICFLYELL